MHHLITGASAKWLRLDKCERRERCLGWTMLPKTFPTEFTPKLFSALREGYGVAKLKADAISIGIGVAYASSVVLADR